MPTRGFSSESFKRTNWEKQHRAKCTHHPPVVRTDQQLKRLHNCAPGEDGATSAVGAGASAGPRYSRRSMHDHTWESFGPILFIWFSLSATSVSSVHLCPLYKKNFTHSAVKTSTQNDTSPGAVHRFRHDHQQNGGQINPEGHLLPSPPLSSRPSPNRKCTEILHKEVI